MKITLTILLAAAGLAAAESTISSVDRYAYAANAGWIDFRPSTADGVIVEESFLAGNAYAANFGWIDLGDGAPDNGFSYSNTSATDFGVNLSPDGSLSGSAYSANTGWITFEPAEGQPRIDVATGLFSGYAYSANLGWISLQTPSSDLATETISRTDSDNDGIADSWEKENFEGSLTAANQFTNADTDAFSDLEEYEADTNPNNSASFFNILNQSIDPSLTSIDVEFTSSPRRLYRLEYDDTLAGPWNDSALGTFAPDPGTSTSRTIAIPGDPATFVRAIAILPLP